MKKLFFQDRGKGEVVILLHGFPMHQKVWDGFAEKLSKHFRVITLDLPGFGKSPILNQPFTIDQVAEQVLSWISENKIEKCVVVGHSLGGYVALAMAKRAPELFDGLILFHSTAYADNDEKKQSRNKVLEFIDNNGVVAFTSNFIAPLFVNVQHPAIEKVRAIATESTKEAVKGYTQAMRDRADRTDVLKSLHNPVLFLAGEKDAGISVESIERQAALSLHSEIQILPEVAHMGMFESEEESLEIIYSFIKKKTVTK